MNLQSNISRWVTFLFGPLAIAAGGFVAVKAKSWFGYDLAPAEATAYMLGIVGGVSALIFKWLHNRGQYEIAKALGTSPDNLDAITTAVLSRLPAAPDAATASPPSPPVPAAGDASPAAGPGGTSPGQ